MFLYRSNRTEELVDTLAYLLRQRPLDDALARERVVVEGRGIERWLTHQLADRLGIWANAEFPFPRHFLRECFAAVLEDAPERTARFEPEALAWSVAALLPQMRAQPEFREVDVYLAHDDGPGRLIALSQLLARVFDQYVTYRPAMISGWSHAQPGEPWQAMLWRRLVANLGEFHVAACARRFIDAVATTPADRLPERVILFGLSTLPEVYLSVLGALSQRIEVHLFTLSPSDTYWAEIRSRREVLRARRARNDVGGDVEAEIAALGGNPLLASLGAVGRDFQALLESTVDYSELGVPGYRTPDRSNALGVLQADILELKDRTQAGARAPWRREDPSVQVHRCHSPMREVQVLHDQLVHAFETDRTLVPEDVIVLCPAIEDYAPFIDAVFRAEGTTAPIPYRVADRSVRSDDEVAAAFTRLLAVLDSRLSIVDGVDLIELRPVRVQFGLAEPDVEQITTWVRAAGVRWGADARHRADSGQPAIEENTWRFGLERLFLGYAMAPLADRPFAGRLPAHEIDGTTAVTLGGLAEFCETLFAWRARTRAPRSVPDWVQTLTACLAACVAEDGDNGSQHQRIRDALAETAALSTAGGFSGELDLATVRGLLEQAIERSAPGRGFASGGVTFCALVPMRSVPHRIVCLLGMNDDAFPRRDRAPAFDLMARQPRTGDRSVRADDRYLFLEALLAARDRLILTYVGRNVRDNATLPPSVVVSELLDAIDATFEIGDGSSPEKVSAALTVDHPLHPFSPRYFDGSDPRLVSYAAAPFAGAAALAAPLTTRRPFVFVTGAITRTANDGAALAIDQLCRFFQNPARGFLAERLGIVLRDRDQEVEEREPIELDSLERWGIADDVLDAALRALRGGREESLFRAEGRLPPGMLGTIAYEHLRETTDAIRARADEWRAGDRLEPIVLETSICGVPIRGVLGDLWPHGHVRATYSRATGKLLVDLWVRHLLLNLARREHGGAESVLIARATSKDSIVTTCLRRVDDPEALLAPLVELYDRGREMPLPFFPNAALAFTKTLAAKPIEAARTAARKEYRPSGREGAPPNEADDPAVRLVFGEDEPLPIDLDHPLFAADPFGDLRFEVLAPKIFGPLLDHMGAAPADDGAGKPE